MNARLLFIHALTPLHAGTGQGVGVIDLPVARERATGLPYLPGSSVKGTLRDACPEASQVAIFGPDTANASDHAGSAQFSDQRLLVLPVRSLAGTFAWVTSPYILRRFARDARDAGATDLPEDVPNPPVPAANTTEREQAWVVFEQSKLMVPQGQQRFVVLEDLDLLAVPDADANGTTTAWAAWLSTQLFSAGTADAAAWQTMFQERFCVVRDDIMSFLLTTATEVTARIRLEDSTKTVATGGLWYEEALPAETILAGLVVATLVTPKKGNRLTEAEIFASIQQLTTPTLQFGGKATVGRGLCRVVLAGQ